MNNQQITISLTRYQEPDWLVIETLESLSQQKNVTATVLFLDQKDETNIKDSIDKLNTENITFKRIPIKTKGLSYARNLAIKMSQTNIILYIDSDAIAKTDWAFYMSEAFSQPNAAIVGSRILLKWHKPALILTKSNTILEQYSYLDLGKSLIKSKKVIGAGFGINKSLLGNNAYFDENLGRRPGQLLGGEETDLCKRAINKELNIYYQGKALVLHQVLPERIRYAWILKRIYYAGVSRSSAGGSMGSTHAMNIWDILFLPVILPIYFLGFINNKFTN